MATRVYHPTLNAWHDIDEADKASWKDAGWRMTKPDHVDDSGALPVAASEPVAAPAPKADKSA